MRLALVCVGGGRGERFGSDKLEARLGGRTVFEVSLTALRSAYPEAPLVVVCAADRLQRWQQRVRSSFPDAAFVAGGDRRQDSVRAGVEAAAGRGAEVVAVHDAARPLVHPADIRRVVEALGDAAAVILCQRVTDTVKRVSEDGAVVATLDRKDLRSAVTPQVFRVDALRQAWQESAPSREWTDEAAMLEAVGLPVRTVEAGSLNPKLTGQDDLVMIRALFAARRQVVAGDEDHG